MSAPTYIRVPESRYGERPPPTRSFLHSVILRFAYCGWVMFDSFFIKIPFYALFFSAASLRPPNASWFGCMMAVINASFERMLFIGIAWENVVGAPDGQHYGFRPTKDATPVWIPQLEHPLTGEVGEMMAQTGEESVSNRAWFYGLGHREADNGEGKIILFFHSGTYIGFGSSPRSPTMAPLTTLLRSNYNFEAQGGIPLRALALEPRIRRAASLPGIIADAVAAWRYLVQDCGYSPDRIVLAGDFGGGHLALALVRYLIDERPFGYALPKGLILLSPWIDLSLSHIYASTTGQVTTFDGWGTKDLCELVASEVLRGLDPDAALGLYASSLSTVRPITGQEFTDFPPAIMSYGGVDPLLNEQKALIDHYADAGSRIEAHYDNRFRHSFFSTQFAVQNDYDVAAFHATKWLQALYT